MIDYFERDRTRMLLGEAWGYLTKTAARTEAAPHLVGELYASSSGWIMLSAPNAFLRGIFSSLHVPGVELPTNDKGLFNAHITVMRPEEVARIGGIDKIRERGRHFSYQLGPIRSVEPEGWPEVERCWFVSIISPELENLRKSYGLAPLPDGNRKRFHATFAIRKRKLMPTSYPKSEYRTVKMAIDKLIGNVGDSDTPDSMPESTASPNVSPEAPVTTKETARQALANTTSMKGHEAKPRGEEMSESTPDSNVPLKLAAETTRPLVTYAPTAALNHVRQHGLLSGRSLLQKPDVLAAIAAARGTTSDEFRKSINEVLTGWKPESANGVNALFADKPATVQLSSEHPTQRWPASRIEIDLASLMRDMPTTRLHGQELMPYNTYKQQGVDDVNLRHRDLTQDEVAALQATPSDVLWQHYDATTAGRMYAPDVPHAAIITNTGGIPAKYLKFPEPPSVKLAAEQLLYAIGSDTRVSATAKLESLLTKEAVTTHSFSDATGTYNLSQLFDNLADRPATQLPIAAGMPGVSRSKRSGFSVKRLANTDLAYPVIVDEHQKLIDGRHRILKALSQGQNNVNAVTATPADLAKVKMLA